MDAAVEKNLEEELENERARSEVLRRRVEELTQNAVQQEEEVGRCREEIARMQARLEAEKELHMVRFSPSSVFSFLPLFILIYHFL